MLRIAALLTILGLACGAAFDATTAVTTSDVVCESWTDCDVACGGGSRQCPRSDGKTWNIDCHVQDCAPTGLCGDADVVFVLDSSASLGEKNWWKAKQFVIDVSKGLTIAPDKSRVAVVSYSNSAYKLWNLEENNSMDDVEAAIWPAEHIAGNTNTYEGLLFAQQILNDTGREDFKHIVIVITDGKSNNRAELVAPTAQEMHDAGTEIFCLGVTNDIDRAEVETIASEPKDKHAFYLDNYDALVAITDSIISETCEAAKRVECEGWSDWTACVSLDQNKKCGPGVSTRYRTCKFYTFPGSNDYETRIHTETRPCDNTCDRCARCEFDPEGGPGHLPHPDNCHQFIQCQYVRTLTGGHYIEHEKSCGALFWRPSLLACDREHDEGYTCIDGPIIDEPEITTPAFVCDKVAHPTRVGWYVWKTPTRDIEMPCAPGTVFNDFSCQCVHGGGNDKVCTSDAILEFPFNTHTDDICNRAVGQKIGNVELKDGAAYFDGTSRVEVPFLKNYFAGSKTTELTVTLWFKYTGDDNDFRGIFTNGDCVDEPSLLVALGSGVAQGVLATDEEAALFDEDTPGIRTVLKDEWVFASMVYNGDDVKYYINGKSQSTIRFKNQQVRVKNTQCPANIGFSANTHFFKGYIDDVRIYTKVLYDWPVQVLFNDGRK